MFWTEKFLHKVWKIRGGVFPFDSMKIMGVLNVTPDSFSDGGRFATPEPALEQALKMEQEGAAMIDLGAESSRPGAREISSEEEISRLIPVLKLLIKKTHLPISIDTTKADVARVCLEEGAHVINDISGLRHSGKAMVDVVRKFSAGLILMHRRGNAETMQRFAAYHDPVTEVMQELRASMSLAVEAGFDEECLMLDPGIGFSKNRQQNFTLLAGLELFHELGRPLLVGHSRKSFLGLQADIPQREFAGTAVTALCAMKNVSMVRVHDVMAHRNALEVAVAVREAENVRS